MLVLSPIAISPPSRTSRVVVDLERADLGARLRRVVPVPILAVSVHSGGILIGAFDGDRMVGFVYSLPGIKDGKPTQWSHMAGVLDSHRSAGVGYQLKLLQRERALSAGLDLVQWTYDPLQALNAHLNFAKLGVVVEEYAVNIYGESYEPAARGQLRPIGSSPTGGFGSRTSNVALPRGKCAIREHRLPASGRR